MFYAQACPGCGEVEKKFFRMHDCRRRKFRLILGQCIEVALSWILRWRCLRCGKRFTDYPPFRLARQTVRQGTGAGEEHRVSGNGSDLRSDHTVPGYGQPYRRYGVATQLIRNLIDKPSLQRRKWISLVVRERNLDVQLFFRAHGFRAVSILRQFYAETSEDANLMQYRCPFGRKGRAMPGDPDVTTSTTRWTAFLRSVLQIFRRRGAATGPCERGANGLELIRKLIQDPECSLGSPDPLS